MSDADAARYSLLLLGGPEANRVTAKLATELPLQTGSDRIVIDGNAFAALNAAVQMIYPHPLNTERYVWIAAGTSARGMDFCDTDPDNPSLDMWDYVITDSPVPAQQPAASAFRTRIVSGLFDYNWRVSDALARRGGDSGR
jgi:hypothetical protein